MIPDVSKDSRYVWMRGSRTRSELTVPVMVKGQVIGVMPAGQPYITQTYWPLADSVTGAALADLPRHMLVAPLTFNTGFFIPLMAGLLARMRVTGSM